MQDRVRNFLVSSLSRSSDLPDHIVVARSPKCHVQVQDFSIQPMHAWALVIARPVRLSELASTRQSTTDIGDMMTHAPSRRRTSAIIAYVATLRKETRIERPCLAALLRNCSERNPSIRLSASCGLVVTLAVRVPAFG